MLAISMGIFAVSYGSTWTDSQQDQAAVPGRQRRAGDRRPRPVVVPPWAQAATFGSLDGVTSVTPVRRDGWLVTRLPAPGS